MATIASFDTHPLVTNTPVPAKGKVLGFRAMQNPSDRNIASCSHWCCLVVSFLRRWDWAPRSSSWSAPWLLSRTLKSCSRLSETSWSGTSLSLERSVTCRRVFSFLDRFRTTQGTNRCLYDFQFSWTLFKARLNIQIDVWYAAHIGKRKELIFMISGATSDKLLQNKMRTC